MSTPLRRSVFCHLVAVVAMLLTFPSGSHSSAQAASGPGPTQTVTTDDPERKHAFEVYKDGKMVAAMPLFEKLAANYPTDGVVWECWGVSTVGYSQTLDDPDLRKKARARARTILLKAKDLGDNSNLVQTLLGMIPEDGGNVTFSSRQEVNDVMQHAEADFGRGDLDKAVDGYIQASLLDPNLYEAPLFTGDVFYKQHKPGSAGEWFKRAIQIDPNRETAYRYWGDALVSLGDMQTAREKFIQAVIADPYGKNSWMGLNQWAGWAKVTLNWVRLQDRGTVSQKDDKNINITLDSGSGKNDDPTLAAWAGYAMERALWHGDKFKQEFPNEPKYRRTMREEADSLHLLVTVLTEQKSFEKKKKHLDPALLQVLAIDKAGLIEPFALLNRADNEIAQDYVAYRAANRDKIFRYMDVFVVPKAPQPGASQ
ncbi:MAG TPA: tetratricopeptide repeat protein [Candidatus Dormibacteraeota bacterium]|nr:tetratricopeptide repeat protein [Candidatus Dormibacteraeota bacterium]